MSHFWGNKIAAQPFSITDNIPFEEAGLLKLNCDKALFYLTWEATLDYNATVELTAQWYSAYYSKNDDLFEFTNQQIEQYQHEKLWRENLSGPNN